MEKNAASGRTPSSLPLSIPPLALNSASPKFGPLSPVQKNSMTVNTDNVTSDFPGAIIEDDVSRVAHSFRGAKITEEQNDRYTSGGFQFFFIFCLYRIFILGCIFVPILSILF